MRPEYEIAEALSASWYGHHGVGGIEVPVGTVASVLVTSPIVLKSLPSMSEQDFAALLREVWAHWWLQHPHLATMARPVTSWLDDPSPQTLKAAKAVADTAMRLKLKNYQGLEVDLLSVVVTELRSHGARKGLGEYHSPPDVCDLMAAMKMTELPAKGTSFVEPTAGTGSMIRALALRIKQLGGNPADYVWHMADIDAIATACSAVNALVWNLGSEVYIAHTNILADGDHFGQAAKHRREAVWAWHESVRDGLKAARIVGAVRAFEDLVNDRDGA